MKPALFHEPEKFQQVARAFEQYFCLELIPEDSGRFVSTDCRDEEPFESIVFTLRRLPGDPIPVTLLPPDAWLALSFTSRTTPQSGEGQSHPRRLPVIPTASAGAFHERFSNGTQDVAYSPKAADTPAKVEHQKVNKEYAGVCRTVEQLIREHGSIEAIPSSQLLKVSLDELWEADIHVKDTFMEKLKEQFHGKHLEEIPIEEIFEGTSVMLLKVKENRGWFLVLAKVDPKTKKPGPRGRKYYWYDEDFPADEGEGNSQS